MTNDAAPVTVISSIGDPRDRRTWSTTPSEILAAMERSGIAVRTHAIATPRPLGYVYLAGNMLSGYGRLQPNRVGLWSSHLRRSASRLIAGAPSGTFLHFGSDHLPLSGTRPGQRHFLVTDYSIHLLMTQGVLGEKAPRRYRDAVLSAEKAIAAQMEAIFTVSRYVADDWRTTYALGAEKVVPIGTGLGNPLTLEGAAKDYRGGHLLFVAKHSFDIKGGPLLVQGFLEALKSRPDLRLVVIADAGDPTLAPWLPTMQTHPSIDFRQSGTPDFVDLMRRAILFVGPAEREPWGLVYLECLMCETPILGLDRNAMRELSDEGRVGFIVEEASAAAVGRAIVDAVSDPERLARMGRSGREFVEAGFTWDQVAARMLRRMGLDCGPADAAPSRPAD
ncbi:MAG TPA: glycosyltransferase family 4 protein [Allosphingosinicella sp.]